MKYDIILAGVGGQGVLTIAFILDNAAIAAGYRFKQAEVHGMAQRGGATYSHLRLSDREVISDLIPLGQADMILSVEPLEVQRYVSFLNRDGVVVSNSQPFKNIPDYPDEKKVLSALLEFPNVVLVDAGAIATSARGSLTQNMAVLGAAVPYLPFEIENFEPFVRELFQRKGKRVVEANLAVLSLGYRCGQFARDLLDAGVSAARVNELMSTLELKAIDPAQAGQYAGRLLGT